MFEEIVTEEEVKFNDKELVKTKQYAEIQPAIEGLKYELGGEYTAVKKLNKLQSYLSSGLSRYS